MSSPQVLRISKKDGSGHLLVYIEPAGRRNNFDLKLTGTDSDVLFECILKEHDIKSLQTSKFSGSLDEWKTILAFVLLHEQPQGPLPECLKGVEIVAEIVESTFTIIIRKIVGAITQTLGNIKLKQKAVEVELFDWIHAAAASSDQLRLQLQTFQTSSTEQQDQIARLTAELDQLVKAKKEHEQELLAKFATLLNEKKLKIRDQQRLLSHAKIDADVADDVQSERSKGQTSRKAGSSRSKRKAKDEEDDEEVASGENEQQTPAASDAETADEEEYEDDAADFAPAPTASQVSTRRSTAPQSQSQGAQRMDIDDDTLPPARQLPFSKPKKAESNLVKSTSAQQAVEEDDEETDDEL